MNSGFYDKEEYACIFSLHFTKNHIGLKQEWLYKFCSYSIQMLQIMTDFPSLSELFLLSIPWGFLKCILVNSECENSSPQRITSKKSVFSSISVFVCQMVFNQIWNNFITVWTKSHSLNVEIKGLQNWLSDPIKCSAFCAMFNS